MGIKTFRDCEFVIFCSACKCHDIDDAEKRALALAFLAANDILALNPQLTIEILSDSLPVLSNITLNNNSSDLIIHILSSLRKKQGIILSKVKAHNGNSGNETADKWAKFIRRKSEEENFITMRMPFKNENNNNNNNQSARKNNKRSSSNPFDGSTEMDIRALTERVLSDENNIGYVTSEGKVMPRNMAFGSGNRNGIELVKQRIWGCDDIMPGDYPVSVNYSDEALQKILAESLKSPQNETGGALIGTWQRDPDGFITVNVERATGPGPEALHNAGLFSPNVEYYKSRVDFYRQVHNWDYLGEWHKHPGDFDCLSSTDIDTANSLIQDEGWPMLLLPIVNKVNGTFTLENNIIFSSQLGGEIMTHIDSLELDEISQHEKFTAYFDVNTIKNFREGKNDTEIITGICNAGESYVFLDIPGVKNSAAKLIRNNGAVSGLENVLTVIIDDENVHCYHAVEGEIEEVESVLINPSGTIYERNAGLTETKILCSKTVTLIGCGSLGSTMAVSLARAGVGHFCLFDPDKLSPVNIARHQAGLNNLGRKKVNVLRDIIHNINPNINVETFSFDIVNSADGYGAFNACAFYSDILICTTDTDDSRMLVNDFAVKNKIKAVQAGLHERAASGIVHVYEPSSDEACFACHRNIILSESNKRNENIAYSEAHDVRDLTIQPGLSAQINTVAEIGTLRVIDSLMNRNSLPSLTVIYIDADNDEDSRKLSLNIRHLGLERVNSCEVCGNFNDDNNTEKYKHEDDAQEEKEGEIAEDIEYSGISGEHDEEYESEGVNSSDFCGKIIGKPDILQETEGEIIS